MPGNRPDVQPDPMTNPEAVIDLYEEQHVNRLDEFSTPEEVDLVTNGLGAVVRQLVELHVSNPERAAEAVWAGVQLFGGLVRKVLRFEPNDELSAALQTEGDLRGEAFVRALLPKDKEG